MTLPQDGPHQVTRPTAYLYHLPWHRHLFPIRTFRIMMVDAAPEPNLIQTTPTSLLYIYFMIRKMRLYKKYFFTRPHDVVELNELSSDLSLQRHGPQRQTPSGFLRDLPATAADVIERVGERYGLLRGNLHLQTNIRQHVQNTLTTHIEQTRLCMYPPSPRHPVTCTFCIVSIYGAARKNSTFCLSCT